MQIREVCVMNQYLLLDSFYLSHIYSSGYIFHFFFNFDNNKKIQNWCWHLKSEHPKGKIKVLHLLQFGTTMDLTSRCSYVWKHCVIDLYEQPRYAIYYKVIPRFCWLWVKSPLSDSHCLGSVYIIVSLCVCIIVSGIFCV